MTQPTTEVIERPSRLLRKAETTEIQLAPYLEEIPRLDEDGMAQIAQRILGAETLEDVFAPMVAEGLLEHLGEVLTITGIRWGDGAFEGGLGVFFALDVIDSAGRKLVLTTGSGTCLLQLARAWRFGAIPGLRVMAMQAEKTTRAGYRPLQLELVR